MNHVCVAVSADAGRTLHGSVREDAQPGDEVVLDDGKLRAFNTPSSQGTLAVEILRSGFSTAN